MARKMKEKVSTDRPAIVRGESINSDGVSAVVVVVTLDASVNVSFTMTDASNVTTTTTADTPSLFMDSPRTIAGLSVETFSSSFWPLAASHLSYFLSLL